MIKLSMNNKGSGIAVIIYGVVLMLALIFTAINILNAKVIENGYNSLRDATLAASSGSVIHLLTTEAGGTASQNQIIDDKDYDVYLQLALGYIINRSNNSSSTSIKGAEVNNFIKLDHKRVVNSTMALFDDAVIRNKYLPTGQRISINNTDKFKIFMFFIEPLYSDSSDSEYEKYFNIIMYTNGDCDANGNLIGDGHIDLAGGEINNITGDSMTKIYENVQSRINALVNENLKLGGNEEDVPYDSFNINLNANGYSLDKFVRQLDTRPYYIVVVKDFALPTLFDGVESNSGDNIFKSAFTSLSGDGKLRTPMCSINSGKVERKLKEV